MAMLGTIHTIALFYPEPVSYSIDDAKEPGESDSQEGRKVRCEYCGAMVDAKLDECPHCGAPIKVD